MCLRWMLAAGGLVAASGCVSVALATNVVGSKEMLNDGRVKIWEETVTAEMLAQTRRHRLQYLGTNLTKTDPICVRVSFDNLNSNGGDFSSGQAVKLEPGAIGVLLAYAETTMYQGIKLDVRYHAWTPGTEGTNMACLKS